MNIFTENIINSLKKENITVPKEILNAIEIGVEEFPQIDDTLIYFKEDFEDLKKKLPPNAIVEVNLDSGYTNVLSEYYSLILFPMESETGVKEKTFIIEDGNEIEISSYENECVLKENENFVLVKEQYKWNIEYNKIAKDSDKTTTMLIYMAGENE